MDPCDCPCFNTRKAAGCVSIIYLLPWPISFLNAFVNNKILVFLGSSVNWPAIDIDTPCWCPQENAICGYVIIFCLRIPCKANTYHQAFSQSYAHLPWYNIKQLFYHESQGGVDNLLCEYEGWENWYVYSFTKCGVTKCIMRLKINNFQLDC